MPRASPSGRGGTTRCCCAGGLRTLWPWHRADAGEPERVRRRLLGRSTSSESFEEDSQSRDSGRRRLDPVVLNVYDWGAAPVAQAVNKVLRPVGVGAFHGAVEVYGREWSYGYTQEGSGVFSCTPRGATQHRFRETVPLGETSLSRREVLAVLHELEWLGCEYDILRRNCLHWCTELCRRLGVQPPPAWANVLANEFAKLDDGVQEVVHKVTETVDTARHSMSEVVHTARQSTSELNCKIRDTVEAEAEKLRGQAEETWTSLIAKAGEIDQQLKLRAATVADDFHRQTQEIQKTLDELSQSAWSSVSSPDPCSAERRLSELPWSPEPVRAPFGSCAKNPPVESEYVRDEGCIHATQHDSMTMSSKEVIRGIKV